MIKNYNWKFVVEQLMFHYKCDEQQLSIMIDVPEQNIKKILKGISCFVGHYFGYEPIGNEYDKLINAYNQIKLNYVI